ncbi:MAG: hypothetical protein IT271_05765 [Chitinophagales bacterium]|nr:hypothetical protein [Chitinophagales bacterium]
MRIENSELRISFILTGILIITSFLPIIQVVIMFLDGGLLSLFNSKNSNFLYLINGISSVLFIILFVIAKNKSFQVFTAIGFIFFFYPLVTYVDENRVPNENEPYFLSALIWGTFSGVLLIVTSYLKILFKTKSNSLS